MHRSFTYLQLSHSGQYLLSNINVDSGNIDSARSGSLQLPGVLQFESSNCTDYNVLQKFPVINCMPAFNI